MTAVNPLTVVIEEAAREVRVLEAVLLEEYGHPLFVPKKTGKAAFQWPNDPEKVSPEEMQSLVQTFGQDAVESWITEHYMTKHQADMVAAESEGTP